MDYPSSNIGGEKIWNENLWKSLKVEIFLKIYMILISIFNLRVISEQVKPYF